LSFSLVVIALAMAAPPPTPQAGVIIGQVQPVRPKDQLVAFVAGTRRAAPVVWEIFQNGARFTPTFLAVSVGDRVFFPNADRLTHSVFSVSKPAAFDTGLYKPGIARSAHMRRPGLVNLFCSIHSNMHSKVVVVPSAHFVVADADGRFRLPEVPAGPQELIIWRGTKEVGRAVVQVQAGREATVEVRGR
jgi:plastocyanin